MSNSVRAAGQALGPGARHNYYDRQGNQIKLMDWTKKFENLAYKQVAITHLPDGKRVSTVWLGINYTFNEKQILIFETMVFPKGTWGELDADRYSTELEAMFGHVKMVRKWLNKK